MSMKPGPCPDSKRLRALLEDHLPPDEQAELSGHLEICAPCQAAIERLAAESRWWNDARELAGDEASAGPAPAEAHTDPHLGPPSFDFLAPPPSPGYLGRFGPYDVIEFIGQGGSGMVFKALDPSLHRLVAVKVLAPQVAVSATARHRFLREARAAASISHDHVVTIHAVDEANGLPYLVMQYVSGKSLQERIERTGPLELKEILRIGMQAASGLAAAHAQGLIHRDVKPANILLENGIERVKLTDFGLARAVDDASLTQSGVIAGTPQYMAPEQARGETVDPRADQFGLGCVLYAMATGHSPFRAPTTMAVLRRVSDVAHRPLRQSNPEIPVWLATIVDRLLAKDPTQRYASSTEVASILSGRLAMLQQADAPAETALLKQPSSSRGLRALPRAAAIVVLVALFAGSEALGVSHVTKFIATVLRIRTPDGTLVLIVEDPSVNVLLDERDVVITGAGPQEIRLKPGLHKLRAIKDENRSEAFLTINRDGRRVASVGIEAPNKPRISVDEFQKPPPRGIQGIVKRADASKPPVELDIGSDGTVAVAAPSQSEAPDEPSPATVIEPPPPPEPMPVLELKGTGTILGVKYSPDNRILVALQTGGLLGIHDIASSAKQRSAPGPGAQQAVPATDDTAVLFTHEVSIAPKFGGMTSAGRFDISPDGRLVAVSSGDGKVGIWSVVELVGNNKAPSARFTIEVHRNVGQSASGAPTLAFSPDGKILATGGVDGKVKLCDPSDGKLLMDLPMGTASRPIHALAFSPDGKLLAVSQAVVDSTDRGVRLWQITTEKPVSAKTLGLLNAGVQGGKAVDLAFDPGTGILATPGTAQPMVLWDIARGRRDAVPLPHDVVSVAFAPDGKTAALSFGSGRVSIRDAATLRKELTSFRAGFGSVNFVAFSPDGRTLATTTAYGLTHVRIWDISNAGLPPVTAARGDALPPALSSRPIQAGVADTPKEGSTETRGPGRTTPKQAESTSLEVVAGEPEPDAPAIEPPPPPEPTPRVEFEHTEFVGGLTYTHDGRYLVGVDRQNKKLLIHDTRNPERGPGAAGPRGTERNAAFTLSVPIKTAYSNIGGFAFSPDGKELAMSTSRSILFWDWATLLEGKTAEPKRDLPIETETANQPLVMFQFSPDWSILATRGLGSDPSEALVKLRDPRTGKVLLELAPMGSTARSIFSIAFSPDGKFLAVLTRSESMRSRGQTEVQLWKIATATPLSVDRIGLLKVESSWSTRAVFSPANGRLITWGSAQSNVLRAWDLAANRVAPIFLGNSAVANTTITELRVSADGALLAVGDDEGGVSLLDGVDYRVLGSFHAGNGRVYDLALSPDGKTLATVCGALDPRRALAKAGGSVDVRALTFKTRVWDVTSIRLRAGSKPVDAIGANPRAARAPAPAPTAGDRGAVPNDEGAVLAARELVKTLLEQAENRLVKAQTEQQLAEAQVVQAKSAVGPISVEKRRALAKLERSRKLVQTNAISAQTVEDDQGHLNSSEAAERSAQIGVQIAEARNLATRARIAEAEAERELALVNLQLLDQHDPGRARRDETRRKLAETRVVSAEADGKIAEVRLAQSKADLDAATALRQLRDQQLERTRKLAESNSVSSATVDEHEAQRDAAIAAETLAKANVLTAEAQLKASAALLEQARKSVPTRKDEGKPGAQDPIKP